MTAAFPASPLGFAKGSQHSSPTKNSQKTQGTRRTDETFLCWWSQSLKEFPSLAKMIQDETQ